jgi:hypothetical protein
VVARSLLRRLVVKLVSFLSFSVPLHQMCARAQIISKTTLYYLASVTEAVCTATRIPFVKESGGLAITVSVGRSPVATCIVSPIRAQVLLFLVRLDSDCSPGQPPVPSSWNMIALDGSTKGTTLSGS